MDAPQYNIFVVGPQAIGSSFFGRDKEIHELEEDMFGETSSNVSLIGPPRIGKSSLVKKVLEKNKGHLNRLIIQIDMSVCASHPYEFWYTLWRSLRSEIENAGLWSANIAEYYRKLDEIDGYLNPNWYTPTRPPLENIFKEIGKKGYRVILAIDRFDDVVRVFGAGKHDKNYYSLLRSVISDFGMVNGVLICKKRIQMMEKEAPNLSHLHGVCKEMPLRAFSHKNMIDKSSWSYDMDAYYGALERYGITLSAEAKNRLEYYTGCLPFICCMFGDCMYRRLDSVSRYEAQDIEAVFRDCRPQIDAYYDDLIKSLKEAGQLESVFQLSIHPQMMHAFSAREWNDMRYMGNSSTDIINGETITYAFSQDFSKR